MEFQGGCQCGRVRYRAAGPRNRASVCFCRMCQKASGGPFMAFVRFPIHAVAWTTEPETFRSSNLAERSFCAHCGTPLTYRQAGAPFISVTLNSLDDPGTVQPELIYAAEGKAAWLQHLDDLPREDAEPPGPGFVSYQRP